MDLKTYIEWKEDPRVGLCPFCSAPGWIVGDDQWCEHYAGTTDSMRYGPLFFKFLDQAPFLRFIELIQSVEQKEIQSLMEKMANEDSLLIQEVLDNDSLYFERSLNYSTLSVDIEEPLSETIYYAHFLSDPVKDAERLSQRVHRTLTQLELGLSKQ